MNPEVIKNFTYEIELEEKPPHRAIFKCRNCGVKALRTLPVIFRDMCQKYADEIDNVLSFHLMECGHYQANTERQIKQNGN